MTVRLRMRHHGPTPCVRPAATKGLAITPEIT